MGCFLHLFCVEDSLYKALEREITNRFELVYTERFEEEQNSYKKSLEQISTDVSKLKLFLGRVQKLKTSKHQKIHLKSINVCCLDDEDRRKRDLPTFDAPVKPNPEIIKESFRLNGPYSEYVPNKNYIKFCCEFSKIQTV